MIVIYTVNLIDIKVVLIFRTFKRKTPSLPAFIAIWSNLVPTYKLISSRDERKKIDFIIININHFRAPHKDIIHDFS